jgi:hypothetical protein
MTGEVALGILLAHLVGDYILQSDYMATEKLKRWWPAVLHGVTYTIPYVLVTRSPWALAIIGSTHIVIDRYRLARYVVWLKNQLGAKREYVYRTPAKDGDPLAGRAWPTRYDNIDWHSGRHVHTNMTVAPPWAEKVRVDPLAWPPTPTGYPAHVPAGLATALLIVADNAIHLVINFGAVKWLG